MKRITDKDLNNLLNQLNESLNRPLQPYIKNEQGKFKACIGNFHIYSAYGSVGLHEIQNEAGGINCIVDLCTKRELYIAIKAMINGINLTKIK